MSDRIPIISRCSTQLANGWAEVQRCFRRGLQTLMPTLRLEDVVSADLFGSANSEARTAYRSGRACMDPNVALYDTAVGWFSKAISLDAKFTQAWLGRAEAYLKISNVDDAIVDFTACLGLAECDSDTRHQVLLGRSSIYKKKGDFSRALKDLTEAIELKPKSTIARLQRSAVYLGLRKLKEALDDADAAIEMEPDNPLALAQLGLTQSAAGQHQRATRSCSRATAAAPTSGYPELFLARASVLLADGRPTESLIDANEAVERGGGIDAYMTRAKTNIALELWDDAICDLTMAYNLNPGDCEILAERAYCFEQLAKYELAIRDRVQALRIKGNCDEAIAAFEHESKQALKLRNSAGNGNKDWDSDQSS